MSDQASPPARRPTRFPYLASLAGEIDKLVFETEHEARKIITGDLAEARARKDEVMGLVKHRLSEHREVVGDLRDKLSDAADQLAGNNSGDRVGNETETNTGKQDGSGK